ncbi:hypothetical protein Bbelb_220640 [Branchiostoma belcheri]|nr:hypothetical protein Bbelb_220640 [Branchiostoma belcheri]
MAAEGSHVKRNIARLGPSLIFKQMLGGKSCGAVAGSNPAHVADLVPLGKALDTTFITSLSPKRLRSSDNQLRHAYKTNLGLFVTRQYETATEGDGHTTRLSGTTTTCASDQLPKKDFEADTPYRNNSNLYNQLRHAYKTNLGLFVTRQYETATEGDGHTTRLSGTTATCASDQLPKKEFEADTPYRNNSNLC